MPTQPEFDAVGPTNDDGTFLHYETTEKFVVTSDRDDKHEYISSDRTMTIDR